MGIFMGELLVYQRVVMISTNHLKYYRIIWQLDDFHWPLPLALKGLTQFDEGFMLNLPTRMGFAVVVILP